MWSYGYLFMSDRLTLVCVPSGIRVSKRGGCSMQLSTAVFTACMYSSCDCAACHIRICHASCMHRWSEPRRWVWTSAAACALSPSTACTKTTCRLTTSSASRASSRCNPKPNRCQSPVLARSIVPGSLSAWCRGHGSRQPKVDLLKQMCGLSVLPAFHHAVDDVTVSAWM